MDRFKHIGENKFQCSSCGEVVPSGIINISGHWAKCEGKEFSDALINRRELSGKITLQDVNYLRNNN